MDVLVGNAVPASGFYFGNCARESALVSCSLRLVIRLGSIPAPLPLLMRRPARGSVARVGDWQGGQCRLLQPEVTLEHRARGERLDLVGAVSRLHAHAWCVLGGAPTRVGSLPPACALLSRGTPRPGCVLFLFLCSCVCAPRGAQGGAVPCVDDRDLQQVGVAAERRGGARQAEAPHADSQDQRPGAARQEVHGQGRPPALQVHQVRCAPCVRAAPRRQRGAASGPIGSRGHAHAPCAGR